MVDGKRGKSSSLKPATSAQFRQRSLNFNFRRYEAQRIQLENEALARRLEERPPHLRTKQLVSEYQSNCQYKQQISRSNLYERLRKLELKLTNQRKVELSAKRNSTALTNTGSRTAQQPRETDRRQAEIPEEIQESNEKLERAQYPKFGK